VTPVPVRRAGAGPRPVTELAERVEAGRSARRSRALRLALGGLLGLSPVLLLAWVLLGSSWLAVDRVQVLGQARLSAADVQQAVAIAGRTPLARVDTTAVERRVGALAPVAAVEVSRSWPGTLRVEVTERTPVAAVVAGAGVTLVDAEGVLFDTERALPAGVVRLEVSAPGPDDPSTLAALQVHGALPAPLRIQVATVRAGSPSTVELVLRDGRQVMWGSPGDTATKSAAALALLRTDSTVVDVSAPGVVVRRGGPSPSPDQQG